MKMQLLAGLVAFATVTSATPLKRASTCGLAGYDRTEAYRSDDSVSFAACSNLCQIATRCQSFAVGKAQCHLYNKQAATNVDKDAKSPYKFYDKDCPAPVTTTPVPTTSTAKPTSTTSTAKPTSTTSTVKATTTPVVNLFNVVVPNTIWKPTVSTPWQVDYSNSIDVAKLPANIRAIDIDLAAVSAKTITALHAKNVKVICYFSAGSYENWRTDWTADTGFNKATDVGKPLKGWPGEWYVDVRKDSVRTVMKNRIMQAKAKGCDAIDPDNVDAYEVATGFTTTVADYIDYAKFLATTSANNGMAFGLKNAPALINDLLPYSQFSVQESCHEQENCAPFNAFINAGKPIFNIEYPASMSSMTVATRNKLCGVGSTAGYSTVLKNLNLDEYVMNCDGTSWGELGMNDNADSG